MLDKTVASTAEAVRDIPDGASIAVGGFGLCGTPDALIEALLEQGAGSLHTISNNCGVMGYGLARLLEAGRIVRHTGSYIGANRELERRYLAGELDVELIPQGTLAERLRAGGAGIPAFYTRAGVGTLVVDGGLPVGYDAQGGVARASSPREVRDFHGVSYALEHGIRADVALVHAWAGDRSGNLVYRRSARNFNPLCATAAALTIAEVENLVEPGELDPDRVDTAGIYVQRIVHAPVGPEGKPVEQRTVTDMVVGG